MNKTHSQYKHGMYLTRQYRIWRGMINRCTYQSNNNYKDYGGKGIEVCQSWRVGFANFWEDMKSGYTEKMTIDRIDNSKGYFTANCRWVDAKEQGRHKSTVKRYSHKGKLMTIPQLAEMYDIKYLTLYARLKRGWKLQEALSKPLLTKYEDQQRNSN